MANFGELSRAREYLHVVECFKELKDDEFADDGGKWLLRLALFFDHKVEA